MTPYSLVARHQRLFLYFINYLFNDAIKYRGYIVLTIRWLINLQQLVEWKLVGEAEVLGGEGLPQCCFVRNKLYI
jgi:hypothetical protein